MGLFTSVITAATGTVEWHHCARACPAPPRNWARGSPCKKGTHRCETQKPSPSLHGAKTGCRIFFLSFCFLDLGYVPFSDFSECSFRGSVASQCSVFSTETKT